MVSSPQLPQAACAGYTEVGLFWDYENLAVPRGHDAAEASNALRTLSLRFGRLVERRVYHDPSKIQSVAPHDRSRLDSAGFTLVECPTRNEKETVDKKIIVDVMHFAITRASRAQQACVVLLTNDGDYSYMLSRLRDLQVKVVVVYLAGHAADTLLHACDHAVSWREDVLCLARGGGGGGGGSCGDSLPPPGTAEAQGYAPHASHGAEVSAHAAANKAAKAALKANARMGASSGRAEAQRVRRQGERARAGAIRKATAPRPERPAPRRRGAHVVARELGALGALGAPAAPRRKKACAARAARREVGGSKRALEGEWTHGVDEWRNVDTWLDAWQEAGSKAGGQRKATKAAQKKKGKLLRRKADTPCLGGEGWGLPGYTPPAGAASWGGFTEYAGIPARADVSPWAMRQGAKRAAKAARNGARVGTGVKKKQKKAGGTKKKVVRKGSKKKGR